MLCLGLRPLEVSSLWREPKRHPRGVPSFAFWWCFQLRARCSASFLQRHKSRLGSCLPRSSPPRNRARRPVLPLGPSLFPPGHLGLLLVQSQTRGLISQPPPSLPGKPNLPSAGDLSTSASRPQCHWEPPGLSPSYSLSWTLAGFSDTFPCHAFSTAVSFITFISPRGTVLFLAEPHSVASCYVLSLTSGPLQRAALLCLWSAVSSSALGSSVPWFPRPVPYLRFLPWLGSSPFPEGLWCFPSWDFCHVF